MENEVNLEKCRGCSYPAVVKEYVDQRLVEVYYTDLASQSKYPEELQMYKDKINAAQDMQAYWKQQNKEYMKRGLICHNCNFFGIV